MNRSQVALHSKQRYFHCNCGKETIRRKIKTFPQIRHILMKPPIISARQTPTVVSGIHSEDSLFSERSVKLVAELNSRYQPEKREQELVLLQFTI